MSLYFYSYDSFLQKWHLSREAFLGSDNNLNLCILNKTKGGQLQFPY